MNTKNKDMINPDIIATKENLLLFVENKVDFFQPDIIKLKKVKEGNYSESINKKLYDYSNKDKITGIGLKHSVENIKKMKSALVGLELFFTVSENGDINIIQGSI